VRCMFERRRQRSSSMVVWISDVSESSSLASGFVLAVTTDLAVDVRVGLAALLSWRDIKCGNDHEDDAASIVACRCSVSAPKDMSSTPVPDFT